MKKYILKVSGITQNENGVFKRKTKNFIIQSTGLFELETHFQNEFPNEFVKETYEIKSVTILENTSIIATDLNVDNVWKTKVQRTDQDTDKEFTETFFVIAENTNDVQKVVNKFFDGHHQTIKSIQDAKIEDIFPLEIITLIN